MRAAYWQTTVYVDYSLPLFERPSPSIVRRRFEFPTPRAPRGELIADCPSPEGIHRVVENISRIQPELGGLPDEVCLGGGHNFPFRIPDIVDERYPNEMTFFPINASHVRSVEGWRHGLSL
jgi:hypothetical protein